jgi:hypothetical protein
MAPVWGRTGSFQMVGFGFFCSLTFENTGICAGLNNGVWL